jgi:hypothetical protein
MKSDADDSQQSLGFQVSVAVVVAEAESTSIAVMVTELE